MVGRVEAVLPGGQRGAPVDPVPRERDRLAYGGVPAPDRRAALGAGPGPGRRSRRPRAGRPRTPRARRRARAGRRSCPSAVDPGSHAHHRPAEGVVGRRLPQRQRHRQRHRNVPGQPRQPARVAVGLAGGPADPRHPRHEVVPEPEQPVVGAVLGHGRHREVRPLRVLPGQQAAHQPGVRRRPGRGCICTPARLARGDAPDCGRDPGPDRAPARRSRTCRSSPASPTSPPPCACRGSAVVQAPPGTGKTTLVPPAGPRGGRPARVVVTQPRRIAVRAAARRLAGLLGEPVGRTRRLHGARRASHRRRDPDRGRHHRHAAAPAAARPGAARRRRRRPRRGARAAARLRPHARDAARRPRRAARRPAARRDVRDRRGRAHGRAASAPAHRRRSSTCPARCTRSPRCGARRRPACGARTSAASPPASSTTSRRCVRRALAEQGRRRAGLPARVRRDRRDRTPAGRRRRATCGRCTAGSRRREQDLALAAGPRRRVVVSTAVAESSLTVPGVRAVVDAGLVARAADRPPARARGPRDRAGQPGRGGPAGRAGGARGARVRSTGAGRSPSTPTCAPHPQPEIATADLTAFALDLACWGSPDGAGLALLDPPPGAAMAAAPGRCAALGAWTGRLRHRARPGDRRGRRRPAAGAGAARRRRRSSAPGGPPRWSRCSPRTSRAPGGDLVAALRGVRRGGPGRRTWRAPSRRLGGSLPAPAPRRGAAGLTDDVAVGLVVALAHPDRVARLRPGAAAYLMASGTGAVLAAGAGAGRAAVAGGRGRRTRGRARATRPSAPPRR